MQPISDNGVSSDADRFRMFGTIAYFKKEPFQGHIYEQTFANLRKFDTSEPPNKPLFVDRG